MSKDILDSKFIKLYKSDMISHIKKLIPDISDNKIEDVLDKMIKKQFKQVNVTIDNNYINQSRQTTLLSIFDWILMKKPIIAGNGTFYHNQNEAINPIANMLDSFAINRKNFKKQLFLVDDPESYEYQTLDRSQLNEKINMNSWYGGSGAPSAAFYSKWSGPATTLSAQSVISTATAMFDGFLGNNQVFIDFDELFMWMNIILKEFHSKYNSTLEPWVVKVDREELIDRLYKKLLSYDEEVPILGDSFKKMINELTDDEVTFIFYKNNMITFFDRHAYIKKLIKSILHQCENFSFIPVNKSGNYIGEKDSWLDEIPKEYRSDYKHKSPKDWNKFASKEDFMDPNDIPENIKELVYEFKDIIMKYIYIQYLSFDRIYRLRNFKRRAAVIIDTDSNIITLDPIMNYIMKYVIKDEYYGRSKEFTEFIIINTLTATITEAIKDTLLFYGKNSYIPKEHRPRFDMKNEFYMSPVIIGNAKKRYISKIKLREGNLLIPPKIDVKGFDFKKSTCSEYAEKYFMNIIKKRIIESPTIDIPGMYKDIKTFEKEIETSIVNGENMFLPNGSVKELDAYQDPASEQSIRGYIAWNLFNPDNPIEPPSKVSLVKLKIFTLDDCKDLQETNPDIYNIIKEKIFKDESGIFISKKKNPDFKVVNIDDKNWLKSIPSKYRSEFKNKTASEWNDFVYSKHNIDYDYKYRGLQVLAIPRNDRIPEWALKYADMTTMINTIISPFRPVMELFGNQTAIEGKTIAGVNRTSEKITNIIKF